MWKAKFTLQDKNPAGEVTLTHVLTEAGFKNKDQVEVWLAVGARERYGVAFWFRCAEVEVVDEEPYIMTQVDPPAFYAGGGYGK